QRTTDTYDCLEGNGTIVESYEESASSTNGSITYNSCYMGDGMYTDGTLLADVSSNISTGNFSLHMSGTLTLSSELPDITLVLDVSYSGNQNSDDFSFTSTISVSGSADGNFLVTTTEPITGNWFDTYSGEMLVEGGEDTRLRITVVATNQADVYLDDGSGSFVYHDTISLSY
ncbi:MAG: hypothetical protein GY779_06895, partial [Gammaproteobacteria bacterium]|nr:hypothetical protein [Gammaproteobacteria bacterium]